MKNSSKSCWTTRWKNEVMPTAISGIWKRKDGGHLVRARVVDPTTGKMKELKKVLPQADEATAYKWLNDQKARVRDCRLSVPRQKMRFCDYATSLFEKKVKTGDIRSAKGRYRWKGVLQHLIVGTTGKTSGKFVAGFGEIFIDRIQMTHVDRWKSGLAELIAAGDYAPSTVNTYFSILRVIDKAAKREHQLSRLFTDGLTDFDLSEHPTYTEEEPNALLPAEVGPFLNRIRELYSQHYAMVCLGFATGLRPSTLRQIRRTGPTADVLWDRNRILIRRSHTMGDEVMDTTKQRRRYPIDVPPDLMAVLRWHIETQLVTPEQQESELLFPALDGRFRTPSVLNKPFEVIVDELQLGKRFTQKGMRRTFNDLARAAKVETLITKSISGHQTDDMVELYSSINPAEQRQSIGKVIDLMTGKPIGHASGALGGAPHQEGGAPTKKAG